MESWLVPLSVLNIQLHIVIAAHITHLLSSNEWTEL